ncbi:hypothetical protein Y032_0239g3313 [Ancylostoma ceylanicum]|uniref:Uncharacterized protein n=1 Tax=Ancylostoma ceylanicum TaxID=53326 RepID=A0A016SE76_9BILA|nr:hypothetical protein Y032_0239g3313 [Ancylostoma ceylanicum]
MIANFSFQTEGTISLDSVSEIDTAHIKNIKKEPPSVLPPVPVLQANNVRTNIMAPAMAIPVSDAIFCERTNPEGPFTAEHRKGDVELGFINQLIAAVLAIVNESGSTELELKVTLDREDNGLPKVIFELIPKARLTNPIERLNRAYVQYAKQAEICSVLLKKIDVLRVRFLSVAAAVSRRDLLDPTWSMLTPHPSFRCRRDGADAQSVYLFEKNRTFHEEMGVASDCETAISLIKPPPKSETPPPEQQQSRSRFSLLSVFNSVFSGFVSHASYYEYEHRKKLSFQGNHKNK